MKVRTVVFSLSLGLTAGTVPLLAHHSFAAEYDANKPVTITGTVTKVEWMNPHARFYVDVKEADGKVTNWNFELGAIPVLLKQGWRKDSLKAGDQVTVEGSRAKGRIEDGKCPKRQAAGRPPRVCRFIGRRRRRAQSIVTTGDLTCGTN